MRRQIDDEISEDFVFVLDLVHGDTSVGSVVTAVQTVGYYSWDRFGRYVHIPSDTQDASLIKAREQLLEELSIMYMLQSGQQPRENDASREGPDAAVRDACEPIPWYLRDRIRRSGWPKDACPDFEALAAGWNERQSGKTEAPLSKVPAPQSKLLEFVKGLLMLNYGIDVLAEFNKNNWSMSKKISEELHFKGIEISYKSIIRYLQDL